MEKRLVFFLMLSFLVMLGYTQLMTIVAPERFGPREGDKPAAQVDRPEREERQDGELAVPDRAPDEKWGVPDDDKGAERGEIESAVAPPAEPPDAIAPAKQIAPAWVSLGSLDPEDAYRMLVTFSNEGAAVERVEMSSDTYRDLEDPSGYLGHLAARDEPGGGCRVNVVGAGTPAAEAGLKSGDIINHINHAKRIGGETIEAVKIGSALQLKRFLETTKPGDRVELTVSREGAGEKTLPSGLLVRRPLEVIRPQPNDVEDVLGSWATQRHPLSFLLTLEQVGQKSIELGEEEIKLIPSLRDGHWEITRSDRNVVEFRMQLDEPQMKKLGEIGTLEIVKRYRLTEVPRTEADNAVFRGYHLTLEIEIHNRGSQDKEVAYRLDGPTGLPLEGWWYTMKVHPTSFGGAGVRDVVWRSLDGGHTMFVCPKIVKRAEDKDQSPDTPMFSGREPERMQYVGVDAKYFAAALLADPDQDEGDFRFAAGVARPVAEIDPIRNTRTDVTSRLTSTLHTIESGGALKERFTIFAGPKDPVLLAQYGLEESIVYGWFGFVTRPMLWILHFFFDIVRNYGLAIIMLTVLVRGCMFPLGRKMALNAQKMQELAPEMKKLAEKYKNDMQKRSQAQRELFKKNNYNPMGGCLLMLFQLPVFIGLYRGLAVDIELRQASLIPGLNWCANLAGPDQFLRWDSFFPPFLDFLVKETGLLGPYFNVLPMFTIALFLIQQKLFMPPATDEQTAMQQKMMKFMMIFMGFLFFKVASGLCLYFIASSLWGIAERKLLPKSKTPQKPAGDPKTRPAPSASGNGASRKAAKTKSKKKQKRK